MDDARDRGYSRAPEIEDLAALCRSLNASRARYLLIGGFAVVLHGYVRATKDVDLLVDPSPENVRALKLALASLPDNAAAELSESELSEYPVVRVADEIVVDLMARAGGVTYEEAVKADVETREIGGVPVPVAGKRLLIRTKDTVRPKDAEDVRFLRLRLENETFNSE